MQLCSLVILAIGVVILNGVMGQKTLMSSIISSIVGRRRIEYNPFLEDYRYTPEYIWRPRPYYVPLRTPTRKTTKRRQREYESDLEGSGSEVPMTIVIPAPSTDQFRPRKIRIITMDSFRKQHPKARHWLDDISSETEEEEDDNYKNAMILYAKHNNNRRRSNRYVEKDNMLSSSSPSLSTIFPDYSHLYSSWLPFPGYAASASLGENIPFTLPYPQLQPVASTKNTAITRPKRPQKRTKQH